jgi:hypothetical protein
MIKLMKKLNINLNQIGISVLLMTLIMSIVHIAL